MDLEGDRAFGLGNGVASLSLSLSLSISPYFPLIKRGLHNKNKMTRFEIRGVGGFPKGFWLLGLVGSFGFLIFIIAWWNGVLTLTSN